MTTCVPQLTLDFFPKLLGSVVAVGTASQSAAEMQDGDTGSPHRGHCILFRAVVSALPAAPTFGCSVASLTRFAGYHAPGLLRLRRGALAHRRLARGSSSVQFARRAWVHQHSHPTALPTQDCQFKNLIPVHIAAHTAKLNTLILAPQTNRTFPLTSST